MKTKPTAKVCKALWESSAITWKHQSIRHCPNAIVGVLAPTHSVSHSSPLLSLPAKNPTQFKQVQSSKSWRLVSPRDFREMQPWLRVRARGSVRLSSLREGHNVCVWGTAGAPEGEKQFGKWGKNVLVTSRGKKLQFLSCFCQQVLIGKESGGDGRWLLVRALWNVSCLFYLFKEQINVQIPQYNYSEFCSCFYWISECCSSELFLRMLPLAHFERLLAFLVCELKFVVGNLEEGSRGY